MPRPLHVSLVATADTQLAPLAGLYETLTAFPMLAQLEPDIPAQPFCLDLMGEDAGPLRGASGLPLGPLRACDTVARTDIAIVPLMMVDGPDWTRGRTPRLVDWLRRMHGRGATLCSTCTGVLLLAETGLLDGGDATIHWAFAPTFRRCHPRVGLRLDDVLVTGGPRQDFVMTGGVASWHDLALHLVTRHVGAEAAAALGRLLMLEWHGAGQAPFRGFLPARAHGDGVVLALQDWAAKHYMVARPVAEMTARTGLSPRAMERRFTRATGLSPLSYVQALRIEEAKRRLERSARPVEEIAAEIGYENTAYFRRLFKRLTRMTPAAYRRRFAIGNLRAGA
ncbi:MAG: helix-turn-helix domain-containing protein [Thiocapsa sp.]|nr:helix-turn-helix domain-containing protein [Thiocapsa sp.]MCG6986502.1 helix-turn-helix domain-containing protein [Thiocapsa sp.]